MSSSGLYFEDLGFRSASQGGWGFSCLLCQPAGLIPPSGGKQGEGVAAPSGTGSALFRSPSGVSLLFVPSWAFCKAASTPSQPRDRTSESRVRSSVATPEPKGYREPESLDWPMAPSPGHRGEDQGHGPWPPILSTWSLLRCSVWTWTRSTLSFEKPPYLRVYDLSLSHKAPSFPIQWGPGELDLPPPTSWRCRLPW